MSLTEINNKTGFANGLEFESKEDLKQYFTMGNIIDMFGVTDLTQEELDLMFEIVRKNKWHCNF